MKQIKNLALLVLLGVSTMCAVAQTNGWPNRPVRLVVSYAAGGSADSLARTVAQKLGERWGQPVNVDNKPGGNTIIAAVEVVRAAPDGYTLLQSINSTLTMNPFASSKLPYDPLRDFTPIGQLTNVPMIWVASNKFPAKTMQELVAYAKSRPNEVTVGSAAVISQAAVEQFARDWGLQFRLVPYKSGVDITKALMSGDIDVGFDGPAVYPQLIKAGKVKALATTGSKKLEAFGGAVPSMAETGLQKTEVPVWYAFMAPANLPEPIRTKIAADLKDVLAMPEVRAKIVDVGMQPNWANAEDLVKLIKSESAVMGPLIKELGITFD